jgi:hypothetical protein
VIAWNFKGRLEIYLKYKYAHNLYYEFFLIYLILHGTISGKTPVPPEMKKPALWCRLFL